MSAGKHVRIEESKWERGRQKRRGHSQRQREANMSVELKLGRASLCGCDVQRRGGRTYEEATL